MSRALTTGVKAASVAKLRNPVWFVFFDFYSGPVYVWSGVGPITWNGHTWLGLGQCGNVTGLTESVETQANGPVFTLTGARSTLIAAVFADNYSGRAVQAWLGMRDTSAGTVIADPYPIFTGRMDLIEIVRDDGQTFDVAVHAESKNYAPNQNDDRRVNDADQQIDFPGDTGLAYLASTGQRILAWGQPNSGVTQGSGSGQMVGFENIP